MRLRALLPTPSLLQLDYLVASDVLVTLVAHTCQRAAACRRCGRTPTRARSRYTHALADLPWLTPIEIQETVHEWNGAPLPEAPFTRVHEPFEQQAARNPDAVALVARDRRLTYGQLDQEADRLAYELIARGVGPETRVGLCLERNPELVIGMLGILKAGGAYVPLDPDYPAERLALPKESMRDRVSALCLNLCPCLNV